MWKKESPETGFTRRKREFRPKAVRCRHGAASGFRNSLHTRNGLFKNGSHPLRKESPRPQQGENPPPRLLRPIGRGGELQIRNRRQAHIGRGCAGRSAGRKRRFEVPETKQKRQKGIKVQANYFSNRIKLISSYHLSPIYEPEVVRFEKSRNQARRKYLKLSAKRRISIPKRTLSRHSIRFIPDKTYQPCLYGQHRPKAIKIFQLLTPQTHQHTHSIQ